MESFLGLLIQAISICILEDGVRMLAAVRLDGMKQSMTHPQQSDTFKVQVMIHNRYVEYECDGHFEEGSSAMVHACTSTSGSEPKRIALKKFRESEDTYCAFERNAYDHLKDVDFVPKIYGSKCEATRSHRKSEPTIYIAMELLREQLSWPYKPPEAPDDIAEVGVEALQMIVSMHRHGVIHRDIKPENLMRVLWCECRCGHPGGLLRFGYHLEVRCWLDHLLGHGGQV
eukprot:TRINITY_DN22955_c0_g1_i2.p1 TRINITY_DN22955_c0_g1~~TRINITY_DN22955_c0_g1_i2.p1  ORF type:complete len:250 (+),score=19.58 TRINITY_DN22955_c0_g1_i2:66-752(+)